MDLRVAAAAPAAAGVRVLGGGVARVPPRPWALRGRRRLSVRMSVATTEAATAAAAAVGAVSALSLSLCFYGSSFFLSVAAPLASC
jgi:hypothetical protein